MDARRSPPPCHSHSRRYPVDRLFSGMLAVVGSGGHLIRTLHQGQARASGRVSRALIAPREDISMNRNIAMLALTVAAGLFAAPSLADTSDKKIAFSNNYA